MPLLSQLIALDTVQTLDGAGSATLRFAVSPADAGLERVFHAAPLGAVLEVALGHPASLHTVFRGPVHAHRLQLASAGVPVMVLEAQSSSGPTVLDEGIALTAQYGATLLALDAERTRDRNTREQVVVRLQGQATLTGTTEAYAGRRLALRGVGETFDGDLRIVAAHHRLSNEGWTTRVDLLADAVPA